MEIKKNSKIFIGILVVGIVLIGGMVILKQAPAEPTKEPAEDAEVVDGLQLTITSDKEVYELGEKIKIKVTMKNVGNEEVIVWHAGFWPNHKIVLVDENKKTVPLTDFGRKCEEVFHQMIRSKNVRWPLAPDQEDKYEFELNKLYLINSFGTYYLTIVYEESQPDGWDGSVTSNTITIEVVEKKGVSKEEALKIAESVCRDSGWEWKDVSIVDEKDKYHIVTNSGRLGSNAEIDIDKYTGKVLNKFYNPE